jgi:hypothetical protein
MDKTQKLKKIIEILVERKLNESFPWPYYYLKNGILVNENGYKAFNNAPKFKDIEDAEKWLEMKNERGNVVGNFEDRPKNKNKF